MEPCRSVGKLNDRPLALRGDVFRMEGQRLPALGREQRQLVVGPRRRGVAALAIGQQSMRDRAALVEGHHLDVAGAEVDVVAQAPISALSATQLAVRQKRTPAFFRIVFMRSGCPIYSLAAILFA